MNASYLVTAALSALGASILTLAGAQYLGFSQQVGDAPDALAAPPREPAADAGRWARMEALLEGLQLAPAEPHRAVAVDVAEVEAVGEGVAEALEAIDKRLGTLQALAVALAGERSGTQEPLDRGHTMDIGQIVALGDLAGSDKAEAMHQVMLLTPAEVVERFGFPTSVNGTTHGLWWSYRNLGPGAAPYTQLQLQFQGGFLTNFEF